jgi:hypothetical protein
LAVPKQNTSPPVEEVRQQPQVQSPEVVASASTSDVDPAQKGIPPDKWLLATAIAPYDSSKMGYLTFDKNEWVLKLHVGPSGTDEEGWIYAQSVDPPFDQGWASAHYFVDVPTQYYPEKLARSLPEIEHQQNVECIHKLIRAEKQMQIAEARAQGAEQREKDILRRHQSLEEEFHERMQTSREQEWRERFREAEKQVNDVRLVLEVVQKEANAEGMQHAHLAAALEGAAQEKREMKKELQHLRSECGPLLTRYQNRDHILYDLYPALHDTVKRMAEGDLQQRLQPGMRRVPVLALRWLHSRLWALVLEINSCLFSAVASE